MPISLSHTGRLWAILLCGTWISLAITPQTMIAGEFNEVLSIGDMAPEWDKLPGVDGKDHSLADLKAKEFVVVVFTCNSCDVATDYEDRIIDFTKRHATAEGRTAVVAINVNTIAADKLPKMKERAEKKAFNFPYLFDESQKIGKAYGAVFTPQFFVLNQDRKVVYMGGMDDNSDAKLVTHHYLEDALQAVLAGKEPTVKEAPSIGCRIRFESERRKKKSS